MAAFAVRHRRRLAAIHANGLKELSLSLPAAFVSRVPLVVWVHNFAVPPSVRISAGYGDRFFGAATCAGRRSRPWPAMSQWASGWPRRKVVIVPNPIDPDDVLATDRHAPPVTVAYVGAPRGYKGFHFLPDIIELAERRTDMRWLVFSQQTDDDLAPAWQRLCSVAGRWRAVPRRKAGRRPRGLRPV